MDWGAILAAAVTGLVAGTLGSLVAPWVQLRVENRREERAHRRALIDRWRQMIASHHTGETQGNIADDAGFQKLRPYLTDEARTKLETPRGGRYSPTIIVGQRGIGDDPDLSLVASEIDRLEREWGLQ